MIHTKIFGKIDNNTVIDQYTLSNSNGSIIKIINYGATVTNIYTANKEGIIEDVVLGYDNLEDYLTDEYFFGAIVGRYANRIAKGKFSLNGKSYNLLCNSGENHLHGGGIGFSKSIWKVNSTHDSENSDSIELVLTSKDGDEGYPGDITLTVTYTLTKDNKFIIEYKAITQKKTIINPTNHCYFNLSGNFNNTILNHTLQIHAKKYLPINNCQIPLGILETVSNSPFDFNLPKIIGDNLHQENAQIINGNGYDHNWIINNFNSKVRLIAEVREEISNRVLRVYSDQPGVQFYTGNYLNAIIGKDKVVYNKHSAFCLETQHFPDSPNNPQFPSTILEPDEKYSQTTIYEFLC